MLLLLAAVLLSSACGSTTPEPEVADEDRLAPRNLFPLGEGYVWNYDIDDGEMNTLGTREVIRVMGDTVEVMVGQSSDTYELRPQGIYHPGTSTWVLKAPIREGAEWPAQGGRTARVESTTMDIEVPAGFFEGCVRIMETGGEQGKEVQTVYCPGVGPVFLETKMQLTLTEVPARVIGRLIGCNLLDRNPGTPCVHVQ